MLAPLLIEGHRQAQNLACSVVAISLSFFSFFFFFFFIIWLILDCVFEFVFWLCLSLEMFKRNDCCVFNRCERRENCFLLSCIIFLSRKIHLKLLQGFLYLEKYCSNFKKILEKFCIWKFGWSWFLRFVLQKINLANLLKMVSENGKKKVSRLVFIVMHQLVVAWSNSAFR